MNEEKRFDVSYWNNRYESGETGWDIGGVSTPLKEYIDQLEDKSVRILIPGCGNCHEAEYLYDNGFGNVTLLDISDILTRRLREKHGRLNIVTGDFFTHEGKYELILEQTFFCALHPSQRTDYAAKCHELLLGGGNIAGVLFDKVFEKEGPPFGGNSDEYRKLFSEYFEIHTLERCTNSIPPRTGAEVFINLKKK